MAQIKGKQLADAPNGISAAKLNSDSVTTAKILDLNVTTGKLAAGVLSADAAGRSKMATSFFDAATVNDKFAASSIALSKLAEAVIQADGGQAFTADQSMGGFKLTNVATPTAGTDAANKDYVDNAVAGLAWKDSVRAATTGNIALSGLLTVDGITLVAGDRVLVKDQTTPAENGIYVAASGAWSRATDADASLEILHAAVFVEEGTANADTMWTMTTNAPITVGTTALTWAQFSSVGTIVGGAGILKTGATLEVELATDPGLEFDAVGDSGRLRAKVNSTGGLERVAAGLGILLNGDSLALSGSGLRAKTPTTSNKEQSPTAGTGNEQTTGLTIAATPGGDGYVRISVNGIGYILGNGVKTKDCYFSADGGTTARAISAIAAGDTLYWNGTIAGFNLETSDVVDMEYEA